MTQKNEQLMYSMAQVQHPEMRIMDKKNNKENTLGEVDAVFQQNQVKLKGTYIVSIARERGLFCGYEDQEDRFDSQKAVLREVMRSLKIIPLDYSQASKNKQTQTDSRSKNLQPTLDINSLVVKASPDIVTQGLRSGSANTDRAIDKYNYYLSGEEARYSTLENRIYVVDSNLSTYAANPNCPQETLSNVPDHLWNSLPHERLYQ